MEHVMLQIVLQTTLSKHQKQNNLKIKSETLKIKLIGDAPYRSGQSQGQPYGRTLPISTM